MKISPVFLLPVVFCCLAAACVSAAPAAPRALTVDISHLASAVQFLSVDEQPEQLRDWAFCGLLTDAGLSTAALRGVFGAWPPLRTERGDPAARSVAGPGRAVLHKGDVLAVVARSRADDPLFIGSLFDRAAARAPAIPGAMQVYAYDVDPGTQTIHLELLTSISSAALMSGVYGCERVLVKNSEDLRRFFRNAQDLIGASWAPDGLTLTGRRISAGRAAGLSPEQVAALYRAYADPFSDEEKKQLRLAYEQAIEEAFQKARTKDPVMAASLRSGRISAESARESLRAAHPFTLPVEAAEIGFSLDPGEDRGVIADAIETLLGTLQKNTMSSLTVAGVSAARVRDLAAAARALRDRRDMEPLLRLERELLVSSSTADMALGGDLQTAELAGSYQQARYSGPIRGTEPGLILFYADLTAKLWALDYQGVAPRAAIEGFRPIPDIPVPPHLAATYAGMSKTRLWFGLDRDSFFIRPDRLAFMPVAVRVYAASSDPRFPGKETAPNYQTGRFIDWWGSRYGRIADYEPYYHKLNQLHKWGCLFAVLAARGDGSLDFLREDQTAPVRDFALWYASATETACRVSLPWRAGPPGSERMNIMRSRFFQVAGKTYFITGGISLPSRREIADKLAGRTLPAAVAGTGKGPAAVGKKTGTKAAKPAPDPGSVPGGPGEFTVRKTSNTVTFGWRKTDGMLMAEYIDALARAQDGMPGSDRAESSLYAVSGVVEVARITLGRLYQVHLEGMKQWVRLSINDRAPLPAGAVQSAGLLPGADVFTARLITAEKASVERALGNGEIIFRVLP